MIDATAVTEWRKPYRHPGRVELSACRWLRHLAAHVPADQAIVELGPDTGRATGWLLLGAFEGQRAHVTTVAQPRDQTDVFDRHMAAIGATKRAYTVKRGSYATTGHHWRGARVGLLRHSGRGDVAADLRAWLPFLADGAAVIVHEPNTPGVLDAVRQVLGRSHRWTFAGEEGWSYPDPQVIPWVYKGRARRERGLLIARKATGSLTPSPRSVTTTAEPEPVEAPPGPSDEEETEAPSAPPGIPKILHRIWLENPAGAPPDPMPQEFEEYGRAWERLHPGWQIHAWRDYTSLPTLANQDLFDRAKEVCPKDWKRFQSDLLRLELLYQYGGVYVDTDVEPLKCFNDLLDHEALVAYSPHRDPSNRRLLTQAVLASAPGHPWIGACISALPDAVRRYKDRPLAQMIGPHHITRVWRKNPARVTVLDSHVFHPQSNRERDAGHAPDLEGAYCWHKWANTRDNRRGGVA